MADDPPRGAHRPAWPELRDRLAEAGFRPSRRLGQNFLVDVNAARAIARDAGVGEGDRVLEVGVGLGFLTLPLLDLGIAGLLAVEIDPRLAALTRAATAGDPRVDWIEADVLAGKHSLQPELARRLDAWDSWHCVSNLPYSISGPLLALLAERDRPPQTMTVLVQHEVACRMLARPGSSDWGPLSVALQLAFRGRMLRELAPGLFRPRPKVQSTLVRLELAPQRLEGAARRHVMTVVRALFQHRRQSLGRSLARRVGPEEVGRVLAELGLESRVRAEQLELEQLVGLAERLPRDVSGQRDSPAAD